jgi:tRNA A-37 threonylcarbamoyl transferase component Bud32
MPTCLFCKTENLDDHKHCHNCGGSMSGATGQLSAEILHQDNLHKVISYVNSPEENNEINNKINNTIPIEKEPIYKNEIFKDKIILQLSNNTGVLVEKDSVTPKKEDSKIMCSFCGSENTWGEKSCNSCGGEFDQNDRAEIGQKLDNRYVIEKVIGRGGMNTVFLAMDERLENSHVVIKQMCTDTDIFKNHKEAVEALKTEARMLTNLHHPMLPRVIDFFSAENGWSYLVMDYVEGDTLKTVLERKGPIQENKVIEWTRKLCEVLDFLHSQMPPVIHRDFKPGNIILTSTGNLKLIDFSIADYLLPDCNSNTLRYGTPGYSPPEHFGENQIDARSDIYSFGATIHNLLTGINPAQSPFSFILPSQVVNVTPVFEKIIMVCVSVIPEERPQSIKEFKRLLSLL